MVQIWVSQFLTIELIKVLPAITLILVGLLVERKYVGRISLLTNAVALSTFFSAIQNLPSWIIYYINILTVFGFIALISYCFKIKLSKHFYWMAAIFSSAISGILLLWGMTLV